jgi:hypothetical protein
MHTKEYRHRRPKDDGNCNRLDCKVWREIGSDWLAKSRKTVYSLGG